ncbi:MAG TPA: hypothetical protein VJV78_09870 [Polyangiales bacterium]|nr:hypothetical protein [Polyangiales bacterium]
MSFGQHAALLWVERGIAVALLLQTIELWQIRRHFSDDGVWTWTILREEQRELAWPARCALGWVMPYRSFEGLLIARLVAAVALLAGASWVTPFLLFSQVAICVRFRGTFNGGSDYMSVTILLALCFALVPQLQRAALMFIAVQTLLSYFNAGVVKLRQPAWRSGQALLAFVSAQPSVSALRLAALLGAPRRRRLLARAVIGYECLTPLALLDPRLCALILALGLGFHLSNALVFGLNRFLFAWAAAYPALFFCSELLGASA